MDYDQDAVDAAVNTLQPILDAIGKRLDALEGGADPLRDLNQTIAEIFEEYFTKPGAERPAYLKAIRDAAK